MRRAQVRFILGIKNMEGEIVIKRWEDLDGEVSSYRLCCLLRLTSTLIRLWSSYNILHTPSSTPGREAVIKIIPWASLPA